MMKVFMGESGERVLNNQTDKSLLIVTKRRLIYKISESCTDTTVLPFTYYLTHPHPIELSPLSPFTVLFSYFC